ncbi:aminotransferase class I/II-fold pyridoxal phosphate-dependent enzyme [Parasphingopyxis algicola]|uniref:aminotransferase class I/II-fold pyridoxal phosphate-dependent enzyme n=1 Tax=Parasphingopyxis algicola TaxID=2026624 RepID=UPI0015A34C84|nr:aminotransferase class I/II-fold pyridoxal phosphate-dependent enzyme [Parasphingopyxis algicola]QLC23909.1 aminotransferase class I/II-fold pyridoxal phosphate-dependent enzyme [Parasphingopyxis algicola]
MRSLFMQLHLPPPDALHGITMAHAADPRLHKMDLGVGVYRNEEGYSPAMEAVKNAERILANSDGSKAYLPTRGHPEFLEGMEGLLFPSDPIDSIVSIQTVGGTGGIYLALELVRRANLDVTVHIGTPSWPNHAGICRHLGVPVREFAHCDPDSGVPSSKGYLRSLEGAKPGDLLILHGPCHNPTGRDLAFDDAVFLVREAYDRGVTCLIDAAYYGLGNRLEDDLEYLKAMLVAAPATMLIMSGSKAFGLYRDRIGILFVNCMYARGEDIVAVLGNIARTTYSVPAAHGAQVIGTILGDPDLKSHWIGELDAMRDRINGLRDQIHQLADGAPIFSSLQAEKGIFSLLPLSSDTVTKLADTYGIYIAGSGRINLAGLSRQTVPLFVEAIRYANG